MTKPLIDKLAASFEKNDPRGLKEHAHSLKGAARSAGCARLGDLAALIQDAVEKNIPVTQKNVDDIKTEWTRVETEIGSL